MFKHTKVMLLLAAMVVTVPLAALGCSAASSQPATASSATTISTAALTPQEIAANAVNAYSQVQTVQMGMDMTMSTEIAGGSQPGKVDTTVNGSGSLDIPSQQANIGMNVSANITGMGTTAATGTQQASTQVIILNNWIYTKVDVPTKGAQWYKTPLTQQLWDQQNQLSLQLDLLKTAVQVTSLPDETVNGVDCYVLSVQPNISALASLISSEISQSSASSQIPNIDFSKMIKNVSATEWVSKTDYLPAKTDIQITMDIQASDIGVPTTTFGEMTTNMSSQVTYTNYNKPVSITLPPDAANATEQTLPPKP